MSSKKVNRVRCGHDISKAQPRFIDRRYERGSSRSKMTCLIVLAPEEQNALPDDIGHKHILIPKEGAGASISAKRIAYGQDRHIRPQKITWRNAPLACAVSRSIAQIIAAATRS
jgi:hypothetical protein